MRWIPIWQRHMLVWRRLFIPSLIGNFGEPLLYLVALGYGLGSFIGEINGLSYVVFLASGIVCSSAMNTATFEGLYSAYTRMAIQKTWEGMLATPISVDDIVLAEIIWAGSKGFVNAVAIMIVAAFLGAVADWTALWVLPIVFLTGLCFGAMALAVTALAKSYDFFQYYFTLVIAPMLMLSGVFFPLTEMPEIVAAIAQLLPLTHSLEIIRPLMVGQPIESLPLHLTVLSLYTLSALLIASKLVKRRLLA